MKKANSASRISVASATTPSFSVAPVSEAAAKTPLATLTGAYNGVAIHRIQKGLSVKLSQFVASAKIDVPHLTFHTGLRVVLMFSGCTHLHLGQNTIMADSQMAQCGLWLPIEHDEQGSKSFAQGESHKELVLFVSQDWLEDWCTTLPSVPDWLHLTGHHLQTFRFTLTPAMTQLAKQLFMLNDMLPLVQHVHRSALVMQLWQAVIRQMVLEAEQRPILRRDAQKRLQELTVLLHSGKADCWTLAQMAAHCGTNITTLQRHFQQCNDMSIWHYLRRLKLERAYHALQSGMTVSIAAEIAGYQHIESFSKAFKQEYGCNPVTIRQLV